MNTRRSVLLALCLMLPTLGSAAESNPIARIGSKEISATELDGFSQAIGALTPDQQQAFAANPGLLSQAVRNLLVRKLVLEEAKSKKWENRPEVAEQVARLRETAIIESYLISVSTPPEAFPSEAELKTAFEANQAVLVVPPQYRISQVFITAPEGAAPEDEAKSKARLSAAREALGKKPFSAVVAEHSDEKSGSDEANLPWLSESLLQPAVRDALKSLKPGGVSEPIRIADGWHIIKVVESRPSRPATFEEVREPLRQRIRAERQQADGMKYVNELLQKNPVSINELELGRLLQSKAR